MTNNSSRDLVTCVAINKSDAKIHKSDSNGDKVMCKDPMNEEVPTNDVKKSNGVENDFGQQRHLSKDFLNPTKMKTTVKGRVQEIEARNFNTLHRGTPKKVTHSEVELKSPIIKYKQPTNHRKLILSSSKKSSSKLKKKNNDRGTMNIGKVRGIIDNFNSNITSKTPKKSLNFNDREILDDSRQENTHKDAFEFLMGARGIHEQKPL